MTFKGLRYELHYHLAARVTSVLAFSLTGDSGYVSPLYGPVCCSSPATPQVERGRPACVGKESELAKRHGSVTSSAPPVLKHLLSRCRLSVRTKSKMAPGAVGVGGLHGSRCKTLRAQQQFSAFPPAWEMAARLWVRKGHVQSAKGNQACGAGDRGRGCGWGHAKPTEVSFGHPGRERVVTWNWPDGAPCPEPSMH